MHPIDDALYRRNRRLIADRLGWPTSALTLQECEWVDRDHPSWHAWWSPGPVGDPRPGYYAIRADARSGERPGYGATPAELVAAVEGRPVRERGIGTFDPLPVSER